MFCQVVVNDENIFTLVHELFSHGASGKGSDVLQRRGIGSAGVDHDGVGQSAAFFQRGHDLRYLSLLLANGHVDADQVAALLVDDGV